MDTGGPNVSMCVSLGAVHSVGTVQGSAVRFSDGRRGEKTGGRQGGGKEEREAEGRRVVIEVHVHCIYVFKEWEEEQN